MNKKLIVLSGKKRVGKAVFYEQLTNDNVKYKRVLQVYFTPAKHAYFQLVTLKNLLVIEIYFVSLHYE